MRRMLRRLVATSSIALAIACDSPTLPLPPPEDIDAVRLDATYVKVSAPCNGAPPNVAMMVINENLQGVSGSITDACGEWSDPNVVANPGDRLTITYEEGEQISQQATAYAP